MYRILLRYNTIVPPVYLSVFKKIRKGVLSDLWECVFLKINSLCKMISLKCPSYQLFEDLVRTHNKTSDEKPPG